MTYTATLNHDRNRRIAGGKGRGDGEKGNKRGGSIVVANSQGGKGDGRREIGEETIETR